LFFNQSGGFTSFLMKMVVLGGVKPALSLNISAFLIAFNPCCGVVGWLFFIKKGIFV